jgi:prenyltransferase beta subunit
MRTRVVLVVSLCLIGGLLAGPREAPLDQDTEFLNRLLNADGGYAPSPARPGTPVRSSLRATTAALRAMKYRGNPPADTTPTAAFVAKCFDHRAGGFGDFPGETPTVTTTAVGTMAAVELKLPSDRYRDAVIGYLNEKTKTLDDIRIAAAAFESLGVRPAKADDWLKQIAATRNEDGTFGKGADQARATGGTAAMILRLGGTLDNRDAVLKAMRAGQRADGGFGSADRDGSDLESTYRIMRAFAMLKEKPTEPDKVLFFIAKCRAKDGGYGVMPGQPATASGCYYAAIVLHWLDAAR